MSKSPRVVLRDSLLEDLFVDPDLQAERPLVQALEVFRLLVGERRVVGQKHQWRDPFDAELALRDLEVFASLTDIQA